MRITHSVTRGSTPSLSMQVNALRLTTNEGVNGKVVRLPQSLRYPVSYLVINRINHAQSSISESHFEIQRS